LTSAVACQSFLSDFDGTQGDVTNSGHSTNWPRGLRKKPRSKKKTSSADFLKTFFPFDSLKSDQIPTMERKGEGKVLRINSFALRLHRREVETIPTHSQHQPRNHRRECFLCLPRPRPQTPAVVDIGITDSVTIRLKPDSARSLIESHAGSGNGQESLKADRGRFARTGASVQKAPVDIACRASIPAAGNPQRHASEMWHHFLRPDARIMGGNSKSQLVECNTPDSD
jgi:hypothetical protein